MSTVIISSAVTKRSPDSSGPRALIRILSVPGARALTWPPGSFVKFNLPSTRQERATNSRNWDRSLIKFSPPIGALENGSFGAWQEREGSYSRPSSKATEEFAFRGKAASPRQEDTERQVFGLLVHGAGRGYLSDGFHQMGINHNILVGISDNSHRVEPLLNSLHLTHHDFSQHDDAAIRRGQTFPGAIGDGPLGFPRHVILRLNRIHPEFRIGVKRIRRVLVGFDILDGRIVILYD